MTSPAKDAYRARGPAGPTLRLELLLERDVNAPALARTAVGRRCADLELGGSLSQTLVLLVSELVSNAVRHSAGPADAPVELIADFTEEDVRVTVTDAGVGFVPRRRDPASTSDGYGLYLLEKAASSWGVSSRGDTKVWFELARGA
jgi:anti-sigma regulatory factor (Ser/Thr protein kinase)